ncbi:MAG: GNAT family N-acetyltransferase [Fervidobacterium sp.]
MELIRKAELSDADIISSLILETGLRFLPLVFGPHVKLILGRLIRTPGTVLYLDNIHVLEIDEGKVVGAIVALPGKIIKKRVLKTSLVLFDLMGIEFLKKIGTFRLIWSKNKIKSAEFYILHVAVDRYHRGMGYGSRLMNFAEKLAVNNRIFKLSLDVENTNNLAIELYKRLGYKGEAVKKVYIKGTKLVFVRMSKILEQR